jgi:Fe-S-cluster containining protein
MMLFTRVLKSIFESYKVTLNEEDYQDFEIHVNNLIANYIQDFSKYVKGVERGRYIHQLIEKEVMASSHIQTSCSKGCGACCHLEVEITEDDAAILSETIKDGVLIDIERLKNQANRPRNASTWNLGPIAENRCLFLGVDNACMVYASRPSTCRKVAVISHPKECSDPQGKIVPLTMPLAEIILSAVLNLPDNFIGSLPKQLIKIIDMNELAAVASSNLVNTILTNDQTRI